MNNNDNNYYRLKDDIDWDGEKKYNRIIYRTWWMVAVNLLLKVLQPFTHEPFLVNVESEMDEEGNPHFIRYCFRRTHYDDLKHCLQELAQCGAVILRMMETIENGEIANG